MQEKMPRGGGGGRTGRLEDSLAEKQGHAQAIGRVPSGLLLRSWGWVEEE